MGCCGSMLQAILFLVNLLIFVCGVAVLGGGIYMEVEMSKYLEFLENQAVSTAIVLIVIGALITVVSFVGCCGAMTSNACLMKTYGAFLCILLIAEVGTAIAIFVLKNDVLELATKSMSKTQATYGQEEYKAPTETWDTVQKEFKCCGVSSYKDWDQATSLKQTSSVPDSCCINKTNGCGSGMAGKTPAEAKQTIHTEGCLDKFVGEVKDHAGIAAGIGIGIGVIQLITIITAICLGRRMDYESHFA